jgi:hypothetical protein
VIFVAKAPRALVLAVLLAGASVAAQQPPAPTVQVAGRVVAADTGVPLRRARIEVTSGRTTEPLFTDDEGRFAIDRTAGESFTITATKAGYASTSVLAAAKASAELRVVMPHGAVVSGRVLESNGAPEAAALVIATRLDAGAIAGARTSFTTTTDDLGDYRLAGLPAGRYAIGARWAGPNLSLQVRVPEPLETINLAIPPLELRWTRGTVLPPVEQTVREVVLRPGDDARPPAMVLPPQPTARSLRAEALARLNTRREGVELSDPFCVGNGIVRGRVLTSGGAPLVAAAVRITDPTVDLAGEWTNRAGEYSVDCLLPGDYTLEVGKLGHVLPGGGGTYRGTVTVREDEPAVNVPDVVFERASVATGAIVDEHGEPLEGVAVRALQVRYVRGRMMAVAAGVQTRTDDRGSFRLFGLGAGEYLVRASAGASLYVGGGGRGRAAGYTPLYYPGTPSIDAALQIRAESGADLSGLHIVFRPSLAARITGTAIDASGAPVTGSVILSASHRSGVVATDPVVLPIGSEGAFAIPDVPSGDYVVHAVVPPGPGRTAEFGSHYVTVTDRDPEPLVIQTSTGGTLDGRLVLEADGPDAARRLGFTLMAYPVDPDRAPFPGRGSGLVTQSDGTFYAVGLYGPRRLTLPQAPPGWYLKSVTIDGTDVTDTGFELPGAAAVSGAEIVLSARGASLSGRVVDDRDRPAEATVVVIPADRSLWTPYSRRLRRTETKDGSFSVQGLPPGEYWVAAVATLETDPAADEWQHPAALDTLVQRAERVTLGESETVDAPQLRRP